jgi:hypothetical protein
MPFDANDWNQSPPSGQGGKDFPLSPSDANPLTGDLRDSVQAHVSSGQKPDVVSISDIHGYLDAARSALLTLSDHSDYEPVVTQDDDGLIHWSGNNYVLVFNGDLIDRGPSNIETLQMVSRLIDEAPTGRVRVTLGNHEMAILTPALFMWDSLFSSQVSASGRRTLVQEILGGRIVAVYEGYNVTYAHAGHSEEYTVEEVNDRLTAAAQQIHGLIGGGADASVQQQLVEDYPFVLGMGEHHPKGPDAGLIWRDLRHLPPDSPPQVVGHTRQDSITQKGQLICENVIRNNIDTTGGEGVLVETPDEIVALHRDSNGEVSERKLTTA